MALITPAQFREHYPRLTGTGEDAVLTTLIDRADDLLAAECGYPEYDSGAGARSLMAQTYTLHLDGPSRRSPAALCLCVRPLGAITSVHVDKTRVYGAASLLTVTTDYVADNNDGLLALAYGSAFAWSAGWRAIRVILVAGYVTTPPGLVAIAASQVRHLWDLRNAQGLTAFSGGSTSESFEERDALLTPQVRASLRPYWSCARAELAAA